MKRAILLRFHQAPFVCRSRVALLRQLNLGVPVYGLFGGSHRVPAAALRALVGLEGVHSSTEPARWNWQHSDLAVASWFREVGRRLTFDVLHLVEWDLLLLEQLESLYASVPEGAVGLTALTPISELERDWTWLNRDANRREWEKLLARARSDWSYDGTPYGCLGPGPCLPRSFVEAYAAIDPPLLCNDELRLPLFAQILGFPVVDNGLRGPWRGEREHEFFHFRAPEIEAETIRAELAKPNGARAFHPVRRRVDHEMIFG